MSEQSSQIKLREAIQLQKAGKIREAIHSYKDFLREKPDSAVGWMNLGTLFAKTGHSSKAIRCYLRSSDLEDHPGLRYNLAVEYYKEEEWTECIQNLKLCLKNDRKNLKAHLLLAYAYQKEGQDDKTEAYLTNAYKLAPKSKTTLIALATFYYDRDKMKQALSFLNVIVNLYPDDSAMKVMKAEILSKTGDFKESLHQLQEVTKSAPGFAHFNDSIRNAKGNQEPEQQIFFDNLKQKGQKKLKEFLTKIELSKENPTDFSPPSAQDAMDLSLVYLFHGDSERAMRYLVYAQKELSKVEPE